MGGTSWIQLVTTLDMLGTREGLWGDRDVGYLDLTEKGLLGFRLEAPANVKVQVTPRGFVQIWFQAGANLVAMFKKLIQVYSPSVDEEVFWFLHYKQLTANMRLTYDLLLAFIWRTLSPSSLPKFRSMLHKRCRHITACLPTAASLIAMEFGLRQDHTDPKVAVMESILRIITNAFEEDGAIFDILMIPILLDDSVPTQLREAIVEEAGRHE